jgi:hypothetical protein
MFQPIRSSLEILLDGPERYLRSSGMALRVTHITTSHVRTDQRIFQKECRSLARAGFEISLIVFDGLGEDLRDGVFVKDLGAMGRGRLGRFVLRPLRAAAYAIKNRSAIYHFHDPELLPVAALLKLLRQRVILRELASLGRSEESLKGSGRRSRKRFYADSTR